jgi:hypothetical protein
MRMEFLKTYFATTSMNALTGYVCKLDDLSPTFPERSLAERSGSRPKENSKSKTLGLAKPARTGKILSMPMFCR